MKLAQIDKSIMFTTANFFGVQVLMEEQDQAIHTFVECSNISLLAMEVVLCDATVCIQSLEAR